MRTQTHQEAPSELPQTTKLQGCPAPGRGIGDNSKKLLVFLRNRKGFRLGCKFEFVTIELTISYSSFHG